MNDERSVERVARLLSLGSSGPRRPVDLLLEDLREHGTDRLDQLLERSAGGQGPCRPLLLEGGADLEQLESLKAACLAPADVHAGLEDHLARLAAYFVAVAAALVHHDTWLSRRRRQALDGVFLDLAATAPEPWAALFERATSAGEDD